jgi:hypothetical protein
MKKPHKWELHLHTENEKKFGFGRIKDENEIPSRFPIRNPYKASCFPILIRL